jgi:hypothetical protein
LQRAQGTRPGPVDRECRLFFIQLYRWFPSVLNAITIVRPETLLRWASRGLSSLLALEIKELRRTATHLDGIAGVDPTHEPREQALGSAAHPRRVAQAGLSRWHSRPSQNTWPSRVTVVRVKAGAPSCATTDRTLLPWICSWSRPSGLSSSTFWSLFVWPGENWSG